MSRPLRPQFPGAIYHVMSRGNGKQEIFHDDADRCHFLGLLERVIVDTAWHCFAFCLMGNHYHLMLETPMPNLSIGMHHLNSGYSTGFKERHGRVGHVMQGRFSSRVIEHERHFLEVYRYMAVNPVDAGLVEKPEDWQWSSYRSVIGLAPVPPFLAHQFILNYFADDFVNARELLTEFVEERLESEHALPYTGTAVVGNQASSPGILKAINAARNDPEFIRNDRYADRPPLTLILEGTEVDRRWRNRMICTAHDKYEYTVAEIGRFLHLNPATVHRVLKKSHGSTPTSPGTDAAVAWPPACGATTCPQTQETCKTFRFDP